jgi:hypothetical protein
MLSRLLTVASTLLIANAIAIPAAMAQCQNPVNPNATNPTIRNLLVGTWYGETYNAQLGMKQQMYQTFLSTGVFEYQDRTCSSISCSQNYGHGYWAGMRQSNGFYIRVQFSDLNRTNQCTGWGVRFLNSTTMVAGGTTYRRVR